MKQAMRGLLLLILLAVVFGGGWLAGTLRAGRRVPVAQLSDLERQFVERMRGATLEGRFTIAGRERDPDRQDHYEIASVEKVGEHDWRFNARIKYGSIDTTLPVVVRMLWADDTPIITMTDVPLPPLGTFTSRVFFYGDRYAGTWQHDAVGGAMFGRIIPAATSSTGSSTAPPAR